MKYTRSPWNRSGCQKCRSCTLLLPFFFFMGSIIIIQIDLQEKNVISNSVRFGPLRHQWCMRFEGKNHELKGYVGHNFINNVPKTVSERHQYYMCLQMIASFRGGDFLQSKDVIGTGIYMSQLFKALNTYQSIMYKP